MAWSTTKATSTHLMGRVMKVYAVVRRGYDVIKGSLALTMDFNIGVILGLRKSRHAERQKLWVLYYVPRSVRSPYKGA